MRRRELIGRKEKDTEVREKVEQRRGKIEFCVNQGGNMTEKGGNEGRGVVMEREQEFEKKFVFWNVARIGNKDKEFWRYIKRFEFISLSETWVDEKSWEIWRERLPKSHEWA